MTTLVQAMDSQNKTVYTVVYHFDVWGNPTEGWEVNDSRTLPDLYVLDGQTILDALKERGLLSDWVQPSDLEIEDMGDWQTVNDSKDHKPLYTLHLKDNENQD